MTTHLQSTGGLASRPRISPATCQTIAQKSPKLKRKLLTEGRTQAVRRELEVLKLRGQGKTFREIAAQLDLQPNQVRAVYARAGRKVAKNLFSVINLA